MSEVDAWYSIGWAILWKKSAFECSAFTCLIAVTTTTEDCATDGIAMGYDNYSDETRETRTETTTPPAPARAAQGRSLVQSTTTFLHGHKKEWKILFQAEWKEEEPQSREESPEESTTSLEKANNEYVDYSYEEEEDHTSSPYKR